MALTLLQRHNVTKSLPLNQAVVFVDRLSQATRRVAQAVFDKSFTLSDPVFTDKGISVNQLEEWALRAIEGLVDGKMLALVLDSPRLAADPEATTDGQILAAVKDNVWPVARMIGKASF
jgi:hypothetical protein